MKLSDYAKSKGISYRTAWRLWKKDELKATQLPSGTVVIDNLAPITKQISLLLANDRISYQ